MKVIKPVKITDVQLISTNVTDTVPQWSGTTTYAQNDSVVYGRGIYKSISATNVNHVPGSADGATHWTYITTSNKWAAFDDQVSNASVSTSEDNTIEFTVESKNTQAIALLNVIGSSVEIEVRDANVPNKPVVYSSSYSLLGNITNWQEYFFNDPDVLRTQAVFLDLPTDYYNTETTIRVSGSQPVSLGICSFGKLVTLGKTELGTSSGITDYSVKQTDEFGQTSFVVRAYSKRMSANVLVQNGELNKIQRLLYDLRAVPALWIASTNVNYEESLVVFGYYKDFTTTIPYPDYSYCSLEIEGLI